MDGAGAWLGCIICRELDRSCPVSLPLQARYLTRTTEDVPDDCKLLTFNRRLAELQVSALDCRKCAALCRALLFHRPTFRLKQEVQIVLGHGVNPSLWVIGMSMEIQLYTPSGLAPAWRNLPCLPETDASPRSDEAIAFAKECLHACLQGHHDCGETTSAATVPTRLIEVGGEGDDRVRLVQGRTVRDTKYVALSYCWGPNPSFMTVKANLQRFMLGISVETLPKTLQDAVFITRKLGIAYLWIDAICIIQDDGADWREEAVRMETVYANSLFTIVAASSPTADHGFLHDRPLRKEFSMDWISDDGVPTVLKARIDPTRMKALWRLPESPWNSRGWTLQEQILSTRLLAFSDAEIQWRCPSSQRCECRGIDGWMGHWSRKGLKHCETPYATYRYWHTLIADEFTQRQFTRYTDKLPALSGIASAVQRKTGSEYLAGLWVENLLPDLCWFVPRPWKPTKPEETTPTSTLQTAEYYAPSFSWASINEHVMYFQTCDCDNTDPWISEAEVLDTSTNILGSSPFGQVTESNLKLRGLLAPCVLNVHTGKETQCWVINGQKDRICDMDGDMCEITYQDISGSPQTATTRLRSVLTESKDGRIPANLTVNLDIPDQVTAHLLLLGTSEEGCNRNRFYFYLILGRSARNPTAAFERLGLYVEEVMLGTETEETPLEPFLKDQLELVVTTVDIL